MQVYTPTPPASIPVLWESSPATGSPKSHGYSNYNVYGYIANGKKRVSHLLKNCAAISKALGTPWHYPYAGTVTVLDQLDWKSHKELLTHLKNVFVSLNISAAWEREVTKSNQIGYHLVVREAPAHLMANRARKLREIIRKSTTVKLNQMYKEIKTYKDMTKWVRYCSKLKFIGSKKTKSDDPDVVAATKATDDIYRSKRVLFKKPPKGVKGETLHRFGDFGSFWEQPTKVSNADYKAKKQAREAKRQAHPEVREAARELAVLTKEHEDIIEQQLHAAYEQADPATLQQLKAENLSLAVQYHGSRDDYDEYLREQAEYRQREQERLLKLRQPRRRQSPPKPLQALDARRHS